MNLNASRVVACSPGRPAVELVWRPIPEFDAPAALLRHRHFFELTLGFVEGFGQIFFPYSAGDFGTSVFLGAASASATAEFSVYIGDRAGITYCTWDCHEHEHLALPEGIKEGTGHIHWDFRDPAQMTCDFQFVLRRRSRNDVRYLELLGNLRGLAFSV